MSQTPDDPGRDGNLMTHDYDGIREYDNPTPGWWHAIFIGTMVFSVLYIAVFHMSPLGQKWGIYARHDRAQERSAAAAFAKLGKLDTDEATLMRLSVKDAALSRGAAVFATKCVACHGSNAGGMVGLGLNLTDDYGKNVKTPEDVYSTIANGVAGTAMVANLPNVLKRDDCILVAAYVISLRGTNAPGGQPPAGEKMPAWPRPPQE